MALFFVSNFCNFPYLYNYSHSNVPIHVFKYFFNHFCWFKCEVSEDLPNGKVWKFEGQYMNASTFIDVYILTGPHLMMSIYE